VHVQLSCYVRETGPLPELADLEDNSKENFVRTAHYDYEPSLDSGSQIACLGGVSFCSQECRNCDELVLNFACLKCNI